MSGAGRILAGYRVAVRMPQLGNDRARGIFADQDAGGHLSQIHHDRPRDELGARPDPHTGLQIREVQTRELPRNLNVELPVASEEQRSRHADALFRKIESDASGLEGQRQWLCRRHPRELREATAENGHDRARRDGMAGFVPGKVDHFLDDRSLHVPLEPERDLDSARGGDHRLEPGSRSVADLGVDQPEFVGGRRGFQNRPVSLADGERHRQ